MKILVAHTYYREFGGEDASYEEESRLLSSSGHEVVPYVRKNTEIDSWGPFRKAGLYFSATSAAQACRELVALARREKPHLVHFHNTHPLISPDAMRAVREAGFPVVATLYNYRFSCVNGLFFRDGVPCEDCHGRGFAWPGVRRACYRGSRLQSAAVARSMSKHHRRGTWSRHVDRWIALTEFARRKAVEAGFPEDRIVAKAPYVHDPGPPQPFQESAPILYVGRLALEKGVGDLLEAAALLRGRREIRIAGDGPDRGRLEQLAAKRNLGQVRFLGTLPSDLVRKEMQEAAFLVVPSRFYETFGRVVAEAFSCGRPAIVSGHGALEELVEPGITGYLSQPGNPPDLARCMEKLLESPGEISRLGANARKTYENRWSPEVGLKALGRVYEDAMRHFSS